MLYELVTMVQRMEVGLPLPSEFDKYTSSSRVGYARVPASPRRCPLLFVQVHCQREYLCDTRSNSHRQNTSPRVAYDDNGSIS